MNRFIEMAITKYINEYPNTREVEILSYLESLGYAKDELESIKLNSLIKRN